MELRNVAPCDVIKGTVLLPRLITAIVAVFNRTMEKMKYQQRLLNKGATNALAKKTQKTKRQRCENWQEKLESLKQSIL